MNTTELGLLFFDNNDPKAIYIQDVSKYNPDIEPSCQRLEITPPSHSTTYTFEYQLLSFTSIDSDSFGWTNTTCYEQLCNLPDGAWNIKQSVAPNDKLFKCYTHYKITTLKNDLLNFINSMVSCSDARGLDSVEGNKALRRLQWIECAKQFAEQFGEIEKANIIYNQISKELNADRQNFKY